MPMKPTIRKDDEAVLLQFKSPWFPSGYLRRTHALRSYWAFNSCRSDGAWGKTLILLQDDFGTLVPANPNLYAD